MVMKKEFTLVYLRTDRQILLGMKKRGFGVGKWNGFAGNLEPNESVIETAARALKEQSCVSVKTSDLKNIGQIEFTFEGDPVTMVIRVYSTSVFEGMPSETEEMIPKWFEYDQIPFTDMWPNDRYWFPYMLKGKLFYAKFHHRLHFKGFDTILNYKIEELDSMEEFYSRKK